MVWRKDKDGSWEHWPDPPERRSRAPRPEPPRDWAPDLTAVPFALLGYDHDLFWYLRRDGRLIALSVNYHNQTGLATLVHPFGGWWNENLPRVSRSDRLSVAREWLFREAQAEIGIFQPRRVRGRGCWREEGGVVLHRGDQLILPSGDSVKPALYTAPGGLDRPLYPPLSALEEEPDASALGRQASRRILRSFVELPLQHPLHGHLLAGYAALAPFSGALSCRPHVWLVGGSGSGKSTVLEDLVRPLLGEMCVAFVGAPAELVRAELGADAFGVIWEEDPDWAGDTMPAVRDLAFSATYEDRTVAVAVTRVDLRVRGMFLFSSVEGRGSDRIHLAKLMKPVPKLARPDPEVGRGLRARTAQWVRDGHLKETIAVLQSACFLALYGSIAHPLATLLAGAWMLKSDDVPSSEEAEAWLQGLEIESLTDTCVSIRSPGTEVLELLFQSRVYLYGGRKRPRIDELIEIALGTASVKYPGISPREAQRVLSSKGIRVERGDGPAVLIANTSKWVGKKLAETSYADSWRKDLGKLPGARATPPMKFGSRPSRAVRIPLDGLGVGPIAGAAA